MSEREQGTEQATPQRKEQMRRRGDVPVSREVATAGSVALLAAFVCYGFPSTGQGLGRLMRGQLGGLSSALERAPASEMLSATWVAAEPVLGWLLAGSVVLGLVAFAGASACLSSERLQPQLERLNPVAGLGRMLSMDALISAVRGILVAGALLASTSGALNGSQAWFSSSAATPLAHMLRVGHHLLSRSTLSIAIALAALDVLVVRWRYEKRIRMSQEDLRQEVKDHEGDPTMRARRRRRQRELLKGAIAVVVPTASVVVANPTHVAVALRYRQGFDAAPVVVAKGVDEVALRIRKLATQHGVPVVTQRGLARALLRAVPMGQIIPSRFFRAVAEVLAYVQRQRLARTRRPPAVASTQAQQPRRQLSPGSLPVHSAGGVL
ncbi:MAG: EscU/YscU/HrcU family type III secretion system export apparatus switch protein [Pseudomonadota bacterium]